MERLKFQTRVSKKRVIKVPAGFHLEDKEVEVTLVSKSREPKGISKAEDFLAKWSGFLSGPDTTEAKWDYLREKYK